MAFPARILIVLCVGFSVHLANAETLQIAKFPDKQSEFTKLDALYSDLACSLEDITPCLLISPDHVIGSGANPSGFQLKSMRSLCIEGVAKRTQKEELCEKVSAVSSAFLDGSQLTAEHCKEKILESKKYNESPEACNNLAEYQFVLQLLDYPEEKAREIAEIAFLRIKKAPESDKPLLENILASVRKKLVLLPDLAQEDALRKIRAKYPECDMKSDKNQAFCERLRCFLSRESASACDEKFLKLLIKKNPDLAK